MTPVDITAGRIMLRPWSPSDVDAVAAICQDPEIQRWTTVPSPYTREDSRIFLTEIAPAGWEAGTMATWGVFDATTAEVLASVGLHGIGEGRAEIGYWCAPAARNRGVLTEAVAAACRWGFGALDLQVIAWVAGVGNWPSRAVAEKCGFRVEGLNRLGMTQRGKRMDCWSGSLLAGDEIVDRRRLPALRAPRTSS
jgi:RimJ/RimL family protein N-acetyltransferase